MSSYVDNLKGVIDVRIASYALCIANCRKLTRHLLAGVDTYDLRLKITEHHIPCFRDLLLSPALVL